MVMCRLHSIQTDRDEKLVKVCTVIRFLGSVLCMAQLEEEEEEEEVCYYY